MRITDVIVLASTKLRAHRVRTGVVTGVSGVLFGLLVATVIIVQGVFDSAEKFDDTGLGDRYIVAASITGQGYYIANQAVEPEVVERVEEAHRQMVAKKQAAAKKHSIDYDAKLEDPSPVRLNSETGKKEIADTMLESPAVKEVERQINEERTKKDELTEKIATYSSAKKLGSYAPLNLPFGSLSYMKDGKEQAGVSDELNSQDAPMFSGSSDLSSRQLYVLPQTVADPFVSVADYDPATGELPIILPYSDAEKLLGFKPLPKDTPASEQRERMREVYRRVGEIRVAYCYRNPASNQLLSVAKTTASEIEKNKNNKEYRKPSLVYAVPEATTCGEVPVVSDTRTAEQKRQDDRQKAYEQEIGTYIGEPHQHKLVFRAVGVSSDVGYGEYQSAVSGMIQSLLSSSLGYGAWNIPAGLLEQVPQERRLAAVFAQTPASETIKMFGDTALVELSDENEARQMITVNQMSGSFWAMPYGSSSLMVSEMKVWFEKILFWAVVVVGIVAAIILSGLVGRTIADSRRETAVFRSIGATRSDISGVYVLYTLMFSLRVVVFTFVLGVVLALVAHLSWTESATLGAQLAYGAIDSTISFGFLGLASPYLPAIAGAIIVVGLVSVVIPLLRNVRRNPISDMRDE